MNQPCKSPLNNINTEQQAPPKYPDPRPAPPDHPQRTAQPAFPEQSGKKGAHMRQINIPFLIQFKT